MACEDDAKRYVELAAPTRCKGATGIGAGQCRSALFNWYKKWYCAPGQNYKDYIAHISAKTARQYPGYPKYKGEVLCLTDPMINAIAEAVIRRNTNLSVVVKGLDGLKTFTTSGEVTSTNYTYIPPWANQRDGNRYVKSGEVVRSKITGPDGNEVEALSVEAENCKHHGNQPGWFVIDDPSGVLKRVNSRAEGLKLGDKVWWISSFDVYGNHAGCEFLGKVPNYVVALNDVRMRGVKSPYFAVDPKWIQLDRYDAELANKSATNALMYFLPPTASTKKRRDEYKTLRRREEQRQAAVEAQKNTLTDGLALHQLTNPYNVYRQAYLTLDRAQEFVNVPLCSDAKARVLAAIEEKKIQADIKKDVEAIIEYQESILREAGYVLTTDEPSSDETPADEPASGVPPLVFWGMAAAGGFVIYKAFFAR